MITWSISTKPCPIITWDGVVSVVNITMLIISTIWFTLDLSVSVFRGHICYMLGSSSLTWVFRVCNCFAPVVFERRAYHTRSSHGVSARRTFATVHTQGEHLYFDNLVRDHLIMLPSIKARWDAYKINIACNQYKWYDMAIIILCLWSPSSKHRRDHHRHRRDTLISIVASLSSRQSYASTTIATA